MLLKDYSKKLKTGVNNHLQKQVLLRSLDNVPLGWVGLATWGKVVTLDKTSEVVSVNIVNNDINNIDEFNPRIKLVLGGDVKANYYFTFYPYGDDCILPDEDNSKIEPVGVLKNFKKFSSDSPRDSLKNKIFVEVIENNDIPNDALVNYYASNGYYLIKLWDIASKEDAPKVGGYDSKDYKALGYDKDEHNRIATEMLPNAVKTFSKQANEWGFSLDSSEVKELLKLLKLAQKYARDTANKVKITILKHEIKVTSYSNERGEFEGAMDVKKYNSFKEGLTMQYNVSYLINIMSLIKGDVTFDIKGNEDITKVTFTNPSLKTSPMQNVEVYIMPMIKD